MEPTLGNDEAVRNEVLAGLSSHPKHLAPWLFYDRAGSSLFERITTLPEYYLTRIERGLLERHAQEIVAVTLPDARSEIVEIGAGVAEKTRVLLRAAVRRHGRARFLPIDVSRDALDVAVGAIARELPQVEVVPVVTGNVDGLASLGTARAPRAIVFLGSSIGNFDDAQAEALLSAARDAAGDGGHFVLGADRVKPLDVLLPAYDDAAGVTAAFNKNVLARINRELGGEFDLDTFAHVVEWNEAGSCVSIYLESKRSQRIRVRGLDQTFSFDRGERIHTEDSIKYADERIDALLERASFVRTQSFLDARGYFGLHLARAVGRPGAPLLGDG